MGIQRKRNDFNTNGNTATLNGATLTADRNASAYTGNAAVVLPIHIRRAISGRYTEANIDNVIIWNRTLTAGEINQLYRSTYQQMRFKAQPVPGTIAPNPATDYAQVNFSTKGLKPCKITGINGRPVSEGNISDKEKISVSQLIGSAYFLETEGIKKLKFLKK